MGSLYVVSDVHGYRDDLVSGLRSAGLLDEDERWSGGEDDLWVLGDLPDRGPDGIGVIELMMSLQAQAPDHVHVLMGNHEALMLGRKRFPSARFLDSWAINGGSPRDQGLLTEEQVRWLAALPLVARVGDFLLMHSDTRDYLEWGGSVDEINRRVREELADGDEETHWRLWARLTSRYDFARDGGEDTAREVLDALGGECIVHGHSIIGSLTGEASPLVESPVLYADGLALDIDGGRYDGGPLLVVRLE